ncbi:MAG: hypothetical protein C4324_06995 [Blastocatellia bacterium]
MRELSLNNSRIDGRYDVIERLGRGSYAEIFRARDRLAAPQTPHSIVVIKALNVFLQDDPDADLEQTLVENFQNEAVALDRVRHPNVISRLGHGTARDLAGVVFHYLVLEYMEGGDLQRLARQRRFSLNESLLYIEQVCAGLRYAHMQGVIHRDIKPQNLLLDKTQRIVKIADFGVARLNLGDDPVTRVGTNAYAPPEHSPLVAVNGTAGMHRRLSPASDIYSLAKSFYTIVTGESPKYFMGSPITELPLAFREEEWANDLRRVLNRATQDDPENRYQSIDEFWSDLESVRRIAADFETKTAVRPALHSTPQPIISTGYSPIAPQRAKFETSRDLKLKTLFAPVNLPLNVGPPNVKYPAIQAKQRPIASDNDERVQVKNEHTVVATPKLDRGQLRHRLILAISGLVAIVLFGAVFYSTAVYLRSINLNGIVKSAIFGPTGTANTDINLRPEPGVDNSPIGLVTKNSRVRILRTQNNWYQVEIIEQGRQTPQNTSSRGWLYSKYVDLD